MNIKKYKKVKDFDTEHGTTKATVLLLNGTPAIRFKQSDPDTGEELEAVVEEGLNVEELRGEAAQLRSDADNIDELIADVEALE